MDALTHFIKVDQSGYMSCEQVVNILQKFGLQQPEKQGAEAWILKCLNLPFSTDVSTLDLTTDHLCQIFLHSTGDIGEVGDLREAFDMLDLDGNGVVEHEAIRDTLAAIKPNIDSALYHSIARNLDRLRKDSIRYDDFCEILLE